MNLFKDSDIVMVMISLNEIRKRAYTFSKKWESETSEDAEAKSFWDDFFQVFGVERRRFAVFEKNIKKVDGKDGFIDVFWKGVMLAEHKTRGKSLEKAFTQAKDYFPGLKNEELPRYVVVSDFARIRLYDLDLGTETEFDLASLPHNIELFNFISGYDHTTIVYEESANIHAVKLLIDLHDEIARTGYSGHDLEILMIRILYCLFAEDTGIFEKGLFREYILHRTNSDGSDLGMHLHTIFEVLSTDRPSRQTNLDEYLQKFPYVNGGIFAEAIKIVACDSSIQLRLRKACEFDWAKISPSVLGSLFQGVLDPAERHDLGAHYTSEENIMKVLKSLFLDDLYVEFEQCRFDTKKLEAFHVKISELTFLDPACGCGNFLVVAYRELRRLEAKIIKQKNKSGQLVLADIKDPSYVNIDQFYGIEIKESSVRIAGVAMHLVDHQMNNELATTIGQYNPRIPIKKQATIIHGDALVVDWEEVISKEKLSYIFGNPPFIGARIMSKEQKENFIKLFDNTKGAGNLDFVTGWYEKAGRYMVGTQIKTAFVSTNSICQGEQVGILWKRLKEKYGVVINFAHQTFKWNNDAPGVAAVYCVIVGFANYDIAKKYLYEYETIKSDPVEKEVQHINGYLVAVDDVFIENNRKPICKVPEIVFGSMPNDGGNFLFTREEKEDFLKIEPGAEPYIKEMISAKEYLNGEKRYCLWLKDIEPSVLRSLPKVLERVDSVKKIRLESTRGATQELSKTPTLFGEIRQPVGVYILVPRVSSENRVYIPMSFFEPDKIAGDTCLIVPNAGLYEFGLLQSLIHMTWVSYVCGRLKSDYRYSNTLVYNNFPWPENLTDKNKKKVEECAQKVLDVRLQFPNSSLADLYDPNTMPPELVKAHNELDKAVDVCYGKRFTTKEERIEFLFELYKKYTTK